jgi:hypothetical protein
VSDTDTFHDNMLALPCICLSPKAYGAVVCLSSSTMTDPAVREWTLSGSANSMLTLRYPQEPQQLGSKQAAMGVTGDARQV